MRVENKNRHWTQKGLRLSKGSGFNAAIGYLDYAMELNLFCSKTKTQWLALFPLIRFLFMAYCRPNCKITVD